MNESVKRLIAIKSTGPAFWAALLGGVFFLVAQSAAFAHTAKYGEADHLHDGYACVYSGVVGLDDGDALAGGDTDCSQPVFAKLEASTDKSDAVRLAVYRPSARGPPNW